MATNRFTLTGAIALQPAVGNPSGVPSTTIPLNETAMVGRSTPSSYVLTTNSATPVAFGGVATANVVQVKVLSGNHVRVRITSADGAAQSIPVDTVLVLMTRENGITAIDLTRDLGVETVVEVFVAEYA
jgi:hypothetical protein